MQSFLTILDGYAMVSILYFTNNLLMFYVARGHLRISWSVLVLLTLMESVAVYQSLHLFWAGNLVVLFLFFLVFSRAVDLETYKLMYINMVAVAYTTVCNLVFFMCWGHAYTWGWREVGLMFLVYSLLSPLVAFLLRRMLWPKLSRMALPASRWIWVLPALVICIDMLIGSAHVQQLLAGYEFVFGITALLLVLSSAGVALMVLAYMDKIQILAKQQNDLQIVDMQIASQSRRFSEMLQYMDEIRVIRHDMRHHVRLATMLLDTGKLEELGSLLHELGQCDTSHDNVIYSSNYIGDLVAHHTQHVAKTAGIKAVFHCGLPKYFWVNDTDLCVLLGNLMENALTACQLQTQGPREIHATAVLRGAEAVIHIENSCGDPSLDTPARREAMGLLKSCGYGIPSVRAIAEKYNGIAAFSRQEGRFIASVLLHKPMEAVPEPPQPRVENEMLRAM